MKISFTPAYSSGEPLHSGTDSIDDVSPITAFLTFSSPMLDVIFYYRHKLLITLTLYLEWDMYRVKLTIK